VATAVLVLVFTFFWFIFPRIESLQRGLDEATPKQ